VAALAVVVTVISELATTTATALLKLTLVATRSKWFQKCDSFRRAGGKLCFYGASPTARLKTVPHPSLQAVLAPNSVVP
jgi:hypothetical protein